MFGKAVDTLQDLMDDEDSRIRLEASKAVMSAHTVTITKTEVIDSTTQMSKETFQHYFGDV